MDMMVNNWPASFCSFQFGLLLQQQLKLGQLFEKRKASTKCMHEHELGKFHCHGNSIDKLTAKLGTVICGHGNLDRCHLGTSACEANSRPHLLILFAGLLVMAAITCLHPVEAALPSCSLATIYVTCDLFMSTAPSPRSQFYLRN